MNNNEFNLQRTELAAKGLNEYQIQQLLTLLLTRKQSFEHFPNDEVLTEWVKNLNKKIIELLGL